MISLPVIKVQSTSLQETTNWILRGIYNETNGRVIRLVNSYSLGLALLDKQYADILSGPGTNIPDGKPLVIARNFNLARSRNANQIRGIDLLRSVLSASYKNQERHFFIGSTDQVLEKMALMIRNQYGLVNVEFYQPGIVSRSSMPSQGLISRIKESNSKIVWVGLGTPNQDFFAKKLADELSVFVISVGAAFDFLSEVKKEAHPLFIKFGVEWLFRLFSEPKRLIKRYLLISPLWLMFLFTRQIFWESE
jgi:N-acetylglucosaminyldiphosphoundecaprenol N-acetyl-beta-D-mannosaminyltransferase